MTHITIENIVARWSDPASRPLFKGRLIDISPDGDVCRCAQGDILHLAGWSDSRLAEASQFEADAKVAALLGISHAHSILLRHVNDRADGCPQDVLMAPEKILGPHAHLVLAFWRHMDAMTVEDWRRVAAAGDAIGAAAWVTAGDAIKNAPRYAARSAAWATARAAARAARAAAHGAGDAAWAAAKATNEIQGHEHLATLVFLPMFGLTIDDLRG